MGLQRYAAGRSDDARSGAADSEGGPLRCQRGVGREPEKAAPRERFLKGGVLPNIKVPRSRKVQQLSKFFFHEK